MFTKGAVLSFLLAAGALSEPIRPRESPKCLDVWHYIAKELKDDFIDNYGLCTNLARQSIRLPFHDCFPKGGCDGSIVLSEECFDRFDNENLIPICTKLADVVRRYKVPVADLVNLAGAIGNKACPGGPYTPFFVGRTDNPTAAAIGQLPPPFFDAQTLLKIFGAKGFTSDELVALVGAHSAGRNHTGTPFDTTIGELDSPTYYGETRAGRAPTSLPSDMSLALDPSTRDAWNEYAASQAAWEADYLVGWTKLITLENDLTTLGDCSEVVFKAFEGSPCVAGVNC
ncbi:hypothetical protein Daus18300_003927 [Diaporthe australafricana]|uniref:Peroxidase n=1 Tax=Diaporthe australafricana TaxID=127596 RepID=A0ABR3XC77_9PEZI